MAISSVPPIFKTCVTCGETKDLEAFQRHSPRYYKNECKQCRKVYQRAYYYKNRPAILLQQKNHSMSRKEERRAYGVNYRETNRDKLKAQRDANKAQRSLWTKAWKRKNRSHVRQYEKDYLSKHLNESRIRSSNRRARIRNLPGTFTVEEELFCRQYFQYACAICEHADGFEWRIAFDHWIPLSSLNCPGTTALNIIPLCHGVGGCNNSKKNKDPDMWLIARFGQRKAARLRQKIATYFAVVRERSV